MRQAPGSTGGGVAGPVTALRVKLTLLLEGFGSVTPEETLPWQTIGPALCGMKVIDIVAWVPSAIEPRLQTIGAVPAQLPCDAVSDTSVTRPEIDIGRVTEGAACGPLLMKMKAQLAAVPTGTDVALADPVKATSADGAVLPRTLLVSVTELLPGPGSATLPVTLAVLTSVPWVMVTSAATVTCADWPAGIVPRLQATGGPGLHDPWLAVAVTP